MTTPQRIQLSRRAGWRKPEGAIVVSRPGPWGNPFSAEDVSRAYPSLDADGIAGMLIANFRDLVNTDGRGLTIPNYRNGDGTRSRREFHYLDQAAIRTALAGHDLACWCPLDQPCHADVLLRIANRQES